MRVLYFSGIIVVLDQVSKLLVKGFSIPFLSINYDGMYPGQRINVFGDFFRITFIENPGMAFGIDPGLNFKLWISLFSLVASIGLIIYLYLVRDQRLSLRISLAFILGGAIGNLIDRAFYGIAYDYAPMFYGKVVDFLDVDFFNFTIFGRHYDRWPIFNIADAAVTIGVLILILFYKKYQNDKEEEDLKYASDGSEIESNNPEIVTEKEIKINEETENMIDKKNEYNSEKKDGENYK